MEKKGGEVAADLDLADRVMVLWLEMVLAGGSEGWKELVLFKYLVALHKLSFSHMNTQEGNSFNYIWSPH